MNRSPAADIFTDNLLTVIREQRHKGTRIVISTQEPTISPRLLDLCTMTFVHRFTSPEWLKVLREHLAGASTGNCNSKGDAHLIFQRIVELRGWGMSRLLAHGHA